MKAAYYCCVFSNDNSETVQCKECQHFGGEGEREAGGGGGGRRRQRTYLIVSCPGFTDYEWGGEGRGRGQRYR